MKKRFSLTPLMILAAGLCTAPAIAENWQKVGYNDMMTVYVDMDSIRPQGMITEVRTKVIPAVTKDFTHGINREIYNCHARQSVIKTMTSFKGRKMVDHLKVKTLEWEPVEPNGVSGLIYKMVCTQK